MKKEKYEVSERDPLKSLVHTKDWLNGFDEGYQKGFDTDKPVSTFSYNEEGILLEKILKIISNWSIGKIKYRVALTNISELFRKIGKLPK